MDYSEIRFPHSNVSYSSAYTPDFYSSYSSAHEDPAMNVISRLVQNIRQKKTLESPIPSKSRDSSPKPNPYVYDRLNADAATRAFKLSQKREEKLQKEREETKQFHAQNSKKLNREQVRQVVQRLNGEAQRRLLTLELRRQDNFLQEEQARKKLIEQRHPKRKLDPAVQSRLLQERKLIESLYGPPGGHVGRGRSVKKLSDQRAASSKELRGRKLSSRRSSVCETLPDGVKEVNDCSSSWSTENLKNILVKS